MKKLIAPKGLVINFAPSERQMEMWNALQPNRCDKCGGQLEMRYTHDDEKGNPIYEPACKNCGNTDIPERVLAGGSAGGGKMINLDSKICTPFGFRKLQDIKKGSIITNPITGGMQKVIWLHPIEEHDFYRIHFIDGTFTDCSEGHLWACHQSREKSKRIKKYDNVPLDKIWVTKDMFDWYQNKKKGINKTEHLIIPLTAPVKFTLGSNKPKIDPYIIGALIGDGCISSSLINRNYVEFINEDKEIVDRFVELGYDMSHYHSKPGSNVNNYTISDSNLVAYLKKIGIAGNTSINHFIPFVYTHSSIEDRIKLMQGLMDTDGYVDDRGHMSYTTISEQLANDVAFVVRSLGGVATIKKDKAGYKNEFGEYVACNDAYTVYFRTKMNPDLCSISRKKKRARYEFNGRNSELGKRIVDIEYIGKQKSRCITVDDPSGLYVIDNFTVTHNSFLGCAWLIQSCISYNDMLFVIARKTLKVLKSTTWKTLLRLLKSWGFKEDVHYHVNNQEGTLTFWNGSVIMQLELSPSLQDPDFNNLGSLEISGAFIDEVSEISEKAVEVLGSRIRYRIADTFVVGKILMSTNPCATWVRSTFVQDDDGEPVRLARGDRFIRFSLFDNPDEKFRATYFNKLRKIRDKATRDRLLYGNWDFFGMNEMAAYWNFDGEVHLVPGLKEKKYVPYRPLILGLDFNVNPYMTCEPCQIDYDLKEIYFFPEYIGKPVDKKLGTPALNNTPAFFRYISKVLQESRHSGSVILTGDPAGKARSTQTEAGTNNFTIASKILNQCGIRNTTELFAKQPSMVTRLDFVNEMMKGYDGWKIFIDVRSRRLTDDLVNQKKNPDGTKEKKKVVNDNGERVERYGHASDCLDYILTYFCSESYTRFKRGATTLNISTVSGEEIVYDTFGGY